MENTNTLKWRPIYIAYALAALSIIMLFFTGVFSRSFAAWMEDVGFNDVIYGVSLQKFILTVLDMSLMFIAFAPQPTEDERVDKIRSFALRNAFLLSMATAVYIGLVITPNFSLLMYAAFILFYYIVLFRLCLYRDPTFVYMSEEELKIYSKKTLKKFNTYFIIQIGLGSAIGTILSDIFHQPQLFWYANLLNLYILVLVRTVYYSWKG